jgi:hypothetical protein
MVSILLNLSKLTDTEFLEKFANKIQQFFELNLKTTESFEEVIKVFKTLIISIKNIQSTSNFYSNFPNIKNFGNLVKFYLKRFFLLHDKDKLFLTFSLPCDYILQDFNIICNILKSNGDKVFWLDCFNYLIKQISDPINAVVNNAQIISSTPPQENIKLIFFENIDKVKC